MSNLVDITFTVKPTVSNGRKLFRDLDTGEMVWEGEEDSTTSVIQYDPAKDLKAKPKAKVKRKPSMQD